MCLKHILIYIPVYILVDLAMWSLQAFWAHYYLDNYLLNLNLTLYMKKFTIVLLSVIFGTLIAGSVQYAAADHLLPGKGIFKDEKHVNLTLSIDTKYQIYLQITVKNAQGQLVNVSEAVYGKYIPHEITDYVFDEMSSKKEIVIIDKMKYEKVQRTVTYDVQQFPFDTSYQDVLLTWTLEFNTNIDGHGLKRLPIFQAALAPISLAEDDILTFHWTFLRVMN